MDRSKENNIVELTEVPGSRDSQNPLNQCAESKFETVVPSQTWPQKPTHLHADGHERILMIVFDIVLIGIPLVLFAKTGLVIRAYYVDREHDGNEIDLVSYLTTFLIRFNEQMTTAFTIVFVTIISTLVRRYALYKAQSGAYVSDLEQLHGSISLPSTLKLIWSLRAFSTTSVALVAIWSFYYLGSQASQREYQRVVSDPYRHYDGYVPGPDYLSGFSPVYIDANPPDPKFISNLNFDFQANKGYADAPFQSYTQEKPGTDMNGQAIVPDINRIFDARLEYSGVGTSYEIPEPDKHGWIDVAKQSRLEYHGLYTSLVGSTVRIPLLRQDDGQVFSIIENGFVGDFTYDNTSYLVVRCDAEQTQVPYANFPNGTYLNQTVSFNMTETRADAPRDRYGHPLREFDQWYRYEEYDLDNPNVVPVTLPDGSTTGFVSSRLRCNISAVYVDMKIHCQDTGCFPLKMRYAGGQSRFNATSYSTAFDDDEFAGNFFSALLLSRGPQTEIYEAQYLIDDMAFNVDTVKSFYINSYYMLSQKNTYQSPTYSETATGAVFRTVTIDGARYNPHYAISWAWIVVDFVSVAILLVAAIVAHLLRVRTLAPDIFGYVSSLTRENPHLAVPDSGTTLNGIQRARLLSKVKVKLGDVSRPDEATGRVGLAQVGARPVENLTPTTAYV